MKVTEGYNEARGYGKVISVLTHERNGIKGAINLIFPHKVNKKYEAQIKRLYAQETNTPLKGIKISDLTIRNIYDDLTVDLSIDKKAVKLINYTYKNKNLEYSKDLEMYNEMEV